MLVARASESSKRHSWSALLPAVRASLLGLSVGYAASLVASLWVRASSADATLVWNLVSPLKLAAWILTTAHGDPLIVGSGAGITAPEAAGSVGRVSELLGGGEDVAFSFSVLLVPVSILALVGATVALEVRRAKPDSPGHLLKLAATAGGTHGLLLGVAAWLSAVSVRYEGVVAPDLGLGAATARLSIAFGHSILVAAGLGALLGAAFASAGGISSLKMRTVLKPDSRIVMLGWMRGIATAAGFFVAALGLGGIVALVTGSAPSLSMFALGGYLLWANAVMAGIVASHGVSMGIALDAGPFTGWERMDLLNFGVAGTGAPKPLLAAVIVPIAAGIVAGRFCRRRSLLSDAGIALRFGALWGLTLAVFSLLLRVRVLSSFSVGAVDLGGGSVAFDPLIALVVGAAWGSVSSYVGARWARETTGTEGIRAALLSLATGSGHPNGTWACPRCEITNAPEDRYCVSCGTQRASES